MLKIPPRKPSQLVEYMSCSYELDVYYELQTVECIFGSDELTTGPNIIQKFIGQLGENFFDCLVFPTKRSSSWISFN